MDQNTPRENPPTKPLQPARMALNVLALCFALSVLGRGLGDSFTVFLALQLPIYFEVRALSGGLVSSSPE